MIQPIPESKKKLIIRNIVNACKDIDKLNSTGYGFIYLASGFIAHSNIGGFKHHYIDSSLMKDVCQNFRLNLWANFNKTDCEYEYYMSRANIYMRIVAELNCFKK